MSDHTEKLNSVLALLDEARGFAAMSPQGRDNIIEVAEILPEMFNELRREIDTLKTERDYIKNKSISNASERNAAEDENKTLREVFKVREEGLVNTLKAVEQVRRHLQRRAIEAEVKVEKLLSLLRYSHDTLREINPSNYDHDDVCMLNDASVEVILAIAPELGETHGQSKEWWAEYALPTPTSQP